MIYRTSNWFQSTDKVILDIGLVSSISLILTIGYRSQRDNILVKLKLLFCKITRIRLYAILDDKIM